LKRAGGSVYVGVSGFSYPAWKGRFYPKDLKSEDFLAYYCKQLGSVEINSSFYAPPKEAMVKGWSERTGEKFRFSFKAPQLITHVMKLGKGSSEAALRFSKTLDLLGPRRGPILFQLPPFTKRDPELLSEFLSKTSEIGDRVFEFRHGSWLQDSVYELLEHHGVSLCIAETEDMKPEFRVTGKVAYFRLRKDTYDAGSVDRWAAKIRDVTKGLPESYVYLRHDETGENAVLAKRLHEKLHGKE
jgi:uncharacterized protein YecE (DUF72 family)